MLNIYITSTVKKEGKTFISTGLAATMQSLGYSTCVYKPVQTCGIELNGFMQSPDLTYIKSIDPYIATNFTYLFKSDAEPLIAAEDENQFIDIDYINNEYKKVLENHDCTIIDGEGGILSPLAPSVQNADMIKKIQVPVVLTVTPRKDTINDALQTLYISLDKGLSVRGVIINNIPENCPKELLTSITRVIEEYSGVNILGLLPTVKNPNSPDELITGILNGIDIESIFGVKIEKLEFSS